MEENKKLSTESYKGVRDFYPKDMAVQKYIFQIMRETVESFGYVEYGASILEPAELYRSKTSDEIVNEQTYTFTDRGDREVTLRPEMTPTVARMVAQKRRELGFPLRWYSIPNVFRYERPQRGRLREHWQLNVDVFGMDSLDADIELLTISHTLLKNFGLSQNDFEIRINDRAAFDTFLKSQGLTDEEVAKARKLIDKKDKVENFDALMEAELGKKINLEMPQSEAVATVIKELSDIGITNVVFTPTLVRGFTYYTGIVFEVFDTHPENNRSLFGGGRFDNLLSLFDNEQVPAVGFGMGDVTIRDALDARGILQNTVTGGVADVGILTLDDCSRSFVLSLANELRAKNLSVETDYTSRKIGDKIAKAEKRGTKTIICVGKTEEETNLFAYSFLSPSEGYVKSTESMDRAMLLESISKKVSDEENNV
ncbi:MAG: histidine--tRNA ligase [Candidatus Paceibacterota bacterium]